METEDDDALPPIEVPTAFDVRDASSANWVVRKIVEARQYAVRVDAWAAAELRRALRDEQFYLHRFSGQLEQWLRVELQGHPKRRSLCLPAGRIGLRLGRPRLSVINDLALLNWCRLHLPLAVKTVETVQKTAVIEHIQSTGESPTGAEWVSGGERFFIGEK